MAKAKLPAGALEFFREQGRKGGKLSGAARMAKLTPEQRSGIAKKASAAAAEARTKKATVAREGKRKRAKK